MNSSAPTISRLLKATAISVFSTSIIFSQDWQNMIPNYSFEKHNLIGWNADVNCGNNEQLAGMFGQYSYIQTYWSFIEEWTHQLRKVPCLATSPPVPTADLYDASCRDNNSRSGNSWGYTGGEYLIVPTFNYQNGGLQSNKLYYIEVFHRGTGNEHLDVFAFPNQPVGCSYNKRIEQYNANKIHDVLLSFDASSSTPISSPLGWKRHRSYFTLNSNKRWLSFGSSGEWDDLRIYEVGQNFCRDNWYFDNTVFNYPFEFFQASDKIYVGNGVDPENGINHIPGDVIQYANTSVVLQAQNQVIIENTFIMEPGSTTLIIENKPCQAKLCPEALSFQNHILCDIPSMEIGTPNPNDWGTQITWSPSTHLSNPNISNPIFTVPAGSTHGGIQYTVTVKYTCDPGIELTRSYPVFVEYSNAGDPTATISASNVVWDVYNFSATFNFNEGVSKISISVPAAPGYFETFYKGTDFNCCSFSWSLPDAWDWSSCSNDVIYVTGTNICSGQEQTITLNWPKTQIPYVFPVMPNVFSPNGDGLNDELCYYVPSADNYTVLIDDRLSSVSIGDNIYVDQSGPVTENPLCLWSPDQHVVLDGVYFVILELTDMCGNKQKHHNFVHLHNGRMQGIDENDIYDAQFLTEQLSNGDGEHQTDLSASKTNDVFLESVNIFPNPSDGIINVTSLFPFQMLKILDYKGSVVYESNVHQTRLVLDNELFVSGIYIVEVYFKNSVRREKIVIQ